jgi:hypothetical protein
VKLTFAYLKTGDPVSKTYTPRGLGWISSGLSAAVAR